MNEFFQQIPNLEIRITKGNNYELKTIEGKIQLPAWAGFQSRLGAYGDLDSDAPSDGTVTLAIGGDMSDDAPTVTREHVEAYRYLTQHQHKIQQVILTVLLDQYPRLQKIFEYDEGDERMPDVKEISQFRSLIGLSNVHLMNVSKDGIAYVGYEFGCTWDMEHGVGVMTHQDRIIELGGADTSFLTWVAEKDLESGK